jgi:hypothetical protein
VQPEFYFYALVITVNLAVGGRLLWKAGAPGARPELLLGAACTLDGVEWLLWVLAYYTPLAGTHAGDWLGAGCRVGIICHNIFLLAFTRLVFRPGSRTARVAVVALAGLMSSSLVIGIAQGDWLGYRSDRIWIWLETCPQLVAYAWTLVESALHYARMRKRLAHGLADPVVTNRVLLWALYGAAMLGAGIFYVISIGVASFSGEYPFALDAAMIACTSFSCGAIWLAFYPPRAYRRWLASASETAPG